MIIGVKIFFTGAKEAVGRGSARTRAPSAPNDPPLAFPPFFRAIALFYFFSYYCCTFHFHLFPPLFSRREFAATMGRQSRQKQHLKRLAAMKQAAAQWTSEKEEESSSSGEEVIWSDKELDQQAEITYNKLLNTLPSKRPGHYSGNSKRTKQRHRAEGRKQAAKNGQTILNFFSPIPVSSNAASDEGGALGNEYDSVEHDSYTSEPDNVVESDSDSSLLEDEELTNDELILNIERRLNSTISQEQRWRLKAVLQYLRLLNFEHSKMKASLSIARQLGRDEYLARRIRSWASVLQKGEEIPVSMRGKHVKVKSLLEDEDVQYEVLQYLRTSKFEFYLADFVHHVSNNIFPNLGINRMTPIGYEMVYLLLFHTRITLVYLLLSMHVMC